MAGSSVRRGMRRGPTIFRAASAVALAAALAAALAVGCASDRHKTPKPGSIVPTSVDRRPATPSAAAKARPRPTRGAPAADSPTAGTDPCANRLHDLGGLLLLYFVTNRRLPERLDDLAPLSDDPSKFHEHITCPASGRPYEYVPKGLPAAGTDRVLLVYDPTPAHGGGAFRWVLLASAPQGDQPLSTWVTPYTEKKFKQHAPANAPQ